jgi:hypothetical protein
MTRRSAAKARQAAAAQAAQAADALLTWLHTQPTAAGPHLEEGTKQTKEGAGSPGGHPAADAGAGTACVERAPASPAPPPTMTADRSDADATTTAPPATATLVQDRHGRHAPLRLAHTDWLYHRLRITGPAADLAAFRTAAAGAGTIPWQLDGDRMEEDLFHLLVAPPAPAGAASPPPRRLSLAGARILAGQLRAAAAHRQALAVARVGQSRACPFDLHALVPVPEAILRCGPDDPEALAWLWQHWGTAHPLRHVAVDAETAGATRSRLQPGEAAFALSFWSADWTPWRALAQITAAWPALRFDTRPTYDTL